LPCRGARSCQHECSTQAMKSEIYAQRNGFSDHFAQQQS
jgi:hypothetical protein